MIVECGGCHTRYRLDDSRVPDTGLLVRCSRCQQVFRTFRAEQAGVPAPSDAPAGATLISREPLAAPGPPATAPVSTGTPGSAQKPQAPPSPVSEIQRLARVVFSDIEIYNAEKVGQSIRQGRFAADFGVEMEEARRMVRNRFPSVPDAMSLFEKEIERICERRRAKEPVGP